MSLVLIIIMNDVIIIMTNTIIVVVLRVKNVFLYIVIKKSCWTVTYSFESGLNFICVGTVNGEGGYVFLKLDCLFFFFYLESISNENKLTIWKWLLFVIVLVYSFQIMVLHYQSGVIST